jgi:hypothetical protein
VVEVQDSDDDDDDDCCVIDMPVCRPQEHEKEVEEEAEEDDVDYLTPATLQDQASGPV